MRCGQMGGKMLYFGRLTVNMRLHDGRKALGCVYQMCQRTIKKVSCFECDACAYAWCCMRANQTAKGAIWRRWGSTTYRAPTGRRQQNESCAGKHIETWKKIEKKNGGKRNRNSKGHRSMAASKNRGREICQSRCDLRTNAAVRHVKRMIRSADGARKHINI